MALIRLSELVCRYHSPQGSESLPESPPPPPGALPAVHLCEGSACPHVPPYSIPHTQPEESLEKPQSSEHAPLHHETPPTLPCLLANSVLSSTDSKAPEDPAPSQFLCTLCPTLFVPILGRTTLASWGFPGLGTFSAKTGTVPATWESWSP